MAIDMNFENLLLEIDAEEKGTNLKSKEVKKAKVMGEEDGEMEYAHE